MPYNALLCTYQQIPSYVFIIGSCHYKVRKLFLHTVDIYYEVRKHGGILIHVNNDRYPFSLETQRRLFCYSFFGDSKLNATVYQSSEPIANCYEWCVGAIIYSVGQKETATDILIYVTITSVIYIPKFEPKHCFMIQHWSDGQRKRKKKLRSHIG